MEYTSVNITSEEITLGQFLKFIDVLSSGGDVKWFLSEHVIYVNEQLENRRGRKLRDGDRIVIQEVGSYQITR